MLLFSSIPILSALVIAFMFIDLLWWMRR